MIDVSNMNTKKRIRTVGVNERGQLVIPEDIRKDFGIKGTTTLVMIEKGREIILRKESDVLETLESDDKFWKALSGASMAKAWEKEDEIWDRLYEEGK